MHIQPPIPLFFRADRICSRSFSDNFISGGRTTALSILPNMTKASFIRLCMSTIGGLYISATNG